jgi:hypothetical protein
MRAVVTAVTFAMLTTVAFAQDSGGLGGGGKGRKAHQNTEQQNADRSKQKADDEAYKAALKRIPEPKEKYDPWKFAR